MTDLKPVRVDHAPVTPPPTIWTPIMVDFSKCKENSRPYAHEISRPMEDYDLLGLLKANQSVARAAYEEWANQVGLCAIASRKDWQDRAERRGAQIIELTAELEKMAAELKELRAAVAAKRTRRRK